jgi:hypothetical protein
MNLFIKNDAGYHFGVNGIKIIEEKYNAKYMGYWCTKRLDGKSWNERPVDVFYVENPDRSKGHTKYFGMFVQEGSVYITNAESAFTEPMTGAICEDGEVIVSRYRHDYIKKGGAMIDGGRNYTRSNMCPLAKVTVKDGEFIIETECPE